MDVMLRNSAEIQEKGKKKDFIYGMEDVDKTLRHIKVVDPFEEVPVGNRHSNVTAEFLLNGHVIGSSSILIRDKKYSKNILFTGDMGKPNQLICGGYEEFVDNYPKDSINAMVVESTCFENTPVAFEERKSQLLGAIKETWEAGGNPLLPVLSFHRAQELMEIIHNCQISGEIPSDCEIFIDAPLAMKVLETFRMLGPSYFTTKYGDNPEFYKTNESSMDRFNLKNLTIVGSHEDSKLMDEKLAFYPAGKAILIASGGMGERGRSVNYIRGKFNQNPKNSIIFNCFQVKGTKGAELVNRSKTETDPTLRAKIIGLDGNTSHISGAEQTFDFLERFNLDNLETVIIGHGRDSSRKAMAVEFKKRGYYYSNIILSRIGQSIAV